MNIDSYSVETLNPPIKSPAVWARISGVNGVIPLVYLKKPKWMDEEDFKEVLGAIRINLPKDYEFKE